MMTKRVSTAVMFVIWDAVDFALAAGPLPSWNDTAPKKTIVVFVEKVTQEGSPDFVPPVRYSATETLDIGMDLGSVVSPSYHDEAPFAFNGQIEKVAFDLR